MKYRLKIGKVSIKNPFVLAPLAGISNLPFRLLCKKYGSGLNYSEMISSEATIRQNQDTSQISKSNKDDSPVSMQIFGYSSVSITNAAIHLEKQKCCDIIDINMGCPAQDIIRTGAGAELLKHPDKIRNIVTSVVDAVKLPITVKIRIGVNKKINAVENAKIIEESGAKAIAVHGRTLYQGYTGKADWRPILKVKESVSIPVIGNGDIIQPTEAKHYLENDYCDAVMIGRASIGNPYIFKEMLHFYETGERLKSQTPKEKIQDYFEYLKLAKKLKLDNISSLRKQSQYFTKGLYDSTTLRAKLNNVSDYKDIKNELEKYMKKI